MAESRLIGSYPVIGIRPTIDGRRGKIKVRESLEDQTMNIAKSAAKLIEEKRLTSMGVYMSYFALAALKKNGEEEKAVALATDKNAWLNMIAQMQYYNSYIKENKKMRLVDLYADEGISGMEMRKRDEFKRMLKDAKNGKIDRILVKSVMRFARNSLECKAQQGTGERTIQTFN